MTRNPHWSPAEDAKLPDIGDVPRRMTRVHWQDISEEIGNNRTWQACRQRYLDLRRKEYHRKPRKANGRIDRRSVMRAAPPAWPEHESITARQFGDPLPGRSALDKLRSAAIAAPFLSDFLPRRTPLDQMRAGLA